MASTFTWSNWRRWHSKRNWLFKKPKLEKPLSSTYTIFSCLFPIVYVIIAIVTLSSLGNSNFTEGTRSVTLKDALPHWKNDNDYYKGMNTELTFSFAHEYISEDIGFDINLNQYYTPTIDQNEEWDCSQQINYNPKESVLNNANNYTDTAELCYNERGNSGRGDGLVLCRDDEDLNTSQIINYLIYHSSDAYYSTDSELLLRSQWDSSQTITITLQFWIHFENGNSGDTYVGTDINLINVEYSPFPTTIPNEEGDTTKKCYGIRVLMDRTVYNVHTGNSIWLFFGGFVAILGGLYSCVLLTWKNTAMSVDMCCWSFCKNLYEKDSKLQWDENDETVQNIQMGMDTSNTGL